MLARPRNTKLLSVANVRSARLKWGEMHASIVAHLKKLSIELHLSVQAGDLLLLNGQWYVTHTGLIRLANRRRCVGIEVQPIPEFSDALNRRYAFKATVYKSRQSSGFAGYGDADPPPWQPNNGASASIPASAIAYFRRCLIEWPTNFTGLHPGMASV